MTFSTFVGLFLFTGLLFVALGIPLALRRVPPNRAYGIRVRSTFADERVWYDANAASGRDMIVTGAVVVIAAAVLPFVRGISATAYALICSVLLVGSLMIGTATGVRRADRMLRDYRGEGGTGAA
jgi:uncharacterized membrane protein